MKNQLMNENCIRFSDALASAAPVPGGGGAAAYCGALAASLCAMAGNVTAGRARYADRRTALEPVLERCERLRLRLLSLVDEDAEGFAPLSAAYAIPREAPDRAERLRRASADACKAPAEMLEVCAELTELLEEMEGLASPLLLSDVGCGAALCASAMESAALNVLVNVRSFPEDRELAALRDKTEEILEKCLPRARALYSRVRAGLES